MSRYMRSSIAALFAAAFSNLFVDPRAAEAKAERKRERQEARRRSYLERGYNNSRMSGLGMRECARRVGGKTWADFKNIDRARRGLAPLQR